MLFITLSHHRRQVDFHLRLETDGLEIFIMIGDILFQVLDYYTPSLNYKYIEQNVVNRLNDCGIQPTKGWSWVPGAMISPLVGGAWGERYLTNHGIVKVAVVRPLTAN